MTNKSPKPRFDFDADDCACPYRHGNIARNMCGHREGCPVYGRWERWMKGEWEDDSPAGVTPPKSPTPGSDWLASVAAENRERDDELERLRDENKRLRAELLVLKNSHRVAWHLGEQRRIRIALLERERDELRDAAMEQDRERSGE